MRKPKITVIIPFFNVERYIGRCSRSLFEQTFEEMEYIFVDDCSTDRSVGILQTLIDEYKVSEKATILHHVINEGVSAARNTGLNHANGDYIGWVDADDWIESEMYERLYQYAKKNQCDLVYCGYVEENNGRSIACTKTYQGAHDPLCNVRALTANEIDAFLWNKLIKRSLLDNHPIVFHEGCNMWEDFAILTPISYYAERIGGIRNPLYHYTIRKGSISLVRSDTQLNAMFKNISIVESFLISINAPDDIFLHLAERKFCLKNSLLMKTGNTEEWRRLFPEVNSQIWKQKACWYIKLYEWCLLNHLDCFYFLYRKYRLIRNKE